MKKKGFTLVELLAVIVILAVIVLIIIPVITGVIEKARIGAAKNSISGYIEALELTIVEEKISFSNNQLSDGNYLLVENSEYGEQISDYNTNIYLNNVITIKGTKPDDGYVTIKDNKVQFAKFIIYNYEITYDGKKITDVVKYESLKPTEKWQILLDMVDIKFYKYTSFEDALKVAYNVSKITSNESAFTYLIEDNDLFIEYLKSPYSGYVMYSNYKITESLLQNSNSALEIMKNSSQYVSDNKTFTTSASITGTGANKYYFYDKEVFLIKAYQKSTTSSTVSGTLYTGTFTTPPNIISIAGATNNQINRFASNLGVSNSTYNRIIYVEYYKLNFPEEFTWQEIIGLIGADSSKYNSFYDALNSDSYEKLMADTTLKQYIENDPNLSADIEEYLKDQIKKDWKVILSGANVNFDNYESLDASLTYDNANVVCSREDLFNQLITSESNVFAWFIENSNARMAMYDNYEVVETILQNSEKALNIMKNSTQYVSENMKFTSSASITGTGANKYYFYDKKAFLIKAYQKSTTSSTVSGTLYTGTFTTTPNIISIAGATNNPINRFVDNLGVSNSTYNRTIYVEYFKIE